MTIQFGNIPDTTRTPGAYVEIDNSRALKGLLQNPHKVLLLGQKIAAGTADIESLMPITRDDLADGYFGPGSVLARMCNVFKDNNPNTEVFAMALSNNGGTVATGSMNFSLAMNSATISGTHTWHLLINGVKASVALTSGMTAEAVASAVLAGVNTSALSMLPVLAAMSGGISGIVSFAAVCSGTLGNFIDIRENYYDGESSPYFSATPISTIVATGTMMEGGGTDPSLADVWAIIDGEQYHYIVQPYIDATNLAAIEDEFADRFLPLEDLQGHGFTAVRGTQASCTTIGNSRNSPHNTIIGIYDAPNAPEEWATALGAIAAKHLNNDPARPLHFLELKGILPPPISSRFTRSERDILLYDGIATSITDSGGKQLIERCITTYQSNSLGLPDYSYLDIQTLATLSEIRYQYKARMLNRFIQPRFKLADDSFPVQPGSYVATPKIVKQETIALFADLRDKGLIENIDDFIDNLVVERDSADQNRVNILLPPDLINQFRILSGLIQFIL